MERLFYCYSRPLRDYLRDNNSFEILQAIHPKTNKKYWVFVGDKKLNELLTEWRLRK